MDAALLGGKFAIYFNVKGIGHYPNDICLKSNFLTI